MESRLSRVVEWATVAVNSEVAASLVEYALLMALIAAVCVAAVSALGGEAGSSFSSISTSI